MSLKPKGTERKQEMEEEITVNGKTSVVIWLKDTPPRVCSKKEDIKSFDETEDCFVLDFDPHDKFDFSEFSLDHKNSHQGDASKDFYIVGENGKVTFTKP